MVRLSLKRTRKKWAKFAVEMAKMISKRKRKKLAKVAARNYLVILAYNRLSRMSLLRTRDFIARKLMSTISFVKRMGSKLLTHSELEERHNSWSKQLPEDIMQLILRRLCIADYVRCGAVCLSWRKAVDMAIASKKGCAADPDQLPWLMLRSNPFSLKGHRFLNLSNHKIYKSVPTYMNRLNCVGSIEGWLIMVDSAFWRPEGFMKPWSFYSMHDDHDRNHKRFSTVNFFLNPISGARVMLPSQSTIQWDDNSYCTLYKVVASSIPTSQHCLVASMCTKGRLAFCRPTDKSWTTITRAVGGLHFNDIVIIDGKLYAATKNGSRNLFVFHIQDANEGPPSYRIERLVMLDPTPVDYCPIISTKKGVKYTTKNEVIYLSKDSASNELFMIRHSVSFAREKNTIMPWHVFLNDKFIIPPHTEGFRVFRLEFNNGPRWVEVVDLAHQILFISDTSCKFIPATDLSNGPHDNTLVQRNCIYFAFDFPCTVALLSSSRRDFGVFSLTDKSIKRHTFPEDHSHSRLHDKPTWFMPNLW